MFEKLQINKNAKSKEGVTVILKPYFLFYERNLGLNNGSLASDIYEAKSVSKLDIHCDDARSKKLQNEPTPCFSSLLFFFENIDLLRLFWATYRVKLSIEIVCISRF